MKRTVMGCPLAAFALALAAGRPADAQDLQIAADTWKDNPSDKVTLSVQMQSLADGTDYAGTVVLAIPSRNIQVRITNSNYQKLAP